MKKIKNFIYLSLVMASSSAFAQKNNNAGDAIESLTGQLTNLGNLMGVLAIGFGSFALFKAVTTLLNHSDDPRTYPLKNIVFYGAGAAIGIGAGLSSDLVQNTIFGDTGNVNED